MQSNVAPRLTKRCLWTGGLGLHGLLLRSLIRH